jgi:ABC-type lipoprotein export system ATPase subunit
LTSSDLVRRSETPREASVLRAVGLRKRFTAPDGRTIEVLRGCDLALAPGEQVAIVGRSGSGKSTLLNLLGCLDRADGGELRFGDLRLTGASRRTLARFRGHKLGFVFQAFNLISELTAWENVLLAARYVGRKRAEAEQAADALFQRLQISERKAHYPPALSGGEQQRVAFCRAVLNDPSVVLADEPTGNLDDDNARVILDELQTRARAGQAAVLLVTHNVELARAADRVLHLVDGQLVS